MKKDKADADLEFECLRHLISNARDLTVTRLEIDKSTRASTTNYDLLFEGYTSHPDDDHLSPHVKYLIELKRSQWRERLAGKIESNVKEDAIQPADTVTERIYRRIAEVSRTFIDHASKLPQRRFVRSAPGTRLLGLVDFFCAPSTVERTFRPLVADWRTEYFEALRQRRTLKARWISIRYVWAFFLAMGLSRVMALLKKVSPIHR